MVLYYLLISTRLLIPSSIVLYLKLQAFGFGQYFEKVSRTLYNKGNSFIKLAHGTSHRFEIGRGIRQGCPISPFLFLLMTQVTATYLIKDDFLGIKIQGIEIKCSQLADDSLFLENRKSFKVSKPVKCLQNP